MSHVSVEQPTVHWTWWSLASDSDGRNGVRRLLRRLWSEGVDAQTSWEIVRSLSTLQKLDMNTEIVAIIDEGYRTIELAKQLNFEVLRCHVAAEALLDVARQRD